MCQYIVTIGALVVSPSILAISYYWPSYCALFTFIFLVPLFVFVCDEKNISLKTWWMRGFFWGLVFYSLHCVFVIPALSVYAHNVSRVLIYLLLVIYASICSALWFFFSALTSKVLKKEISWVLGTWFYFYLFEQYTLIPLGFPGGYCFANPLFLLAYKQNRFVLLFLCISVQMIFVCVQPKRIWAKLTLFCLLIFVLHMNREQNQAISSDLYVQCLIPPTPDLDSCLDTAQAITATLIDASFEYPDTSVFVMPEGAFPYPLNNYPEGMHMWFDNALHDDKHFFIGAYCKEGDCLFNCVYHLYQRRIMQIYRKSLLMPFTERTPLLFKQNRIIQGLFLQNKEFTGGGEGVDRTLALCSDFFLSSHRYKDSKHLFLLVNDMWFMPYMKRILYLYAYAFAREHNIELVYSSYS